MNRITYLLITLSIIISISAKDENYPGSIKELIQINLKAPIALTNNADDLFIIDKEKGMIYKMNLKNKTLLEYIITPGTEPTSITSDGRYLYILDVDDKAIYKMDIQTKQTIKRLEIDVDMPLSIAYGDGYLFINDLSKKTINKIDINDATTISTFQMPSAGKGRATEEYGMVYKNGYLYITDRNTDSIYQVYVRTGDVVNIYHIPELPFMTGIAFDNDDLLVLDMERMAVARINIKAEKTAYRRNKKTEVITYKERYKNFGPDKVDKITISIAIPKDLPNQDILSVEFTPSRYESVKDKWGQEIAHFVFKNIKPMEEISAEMKVKANIYEIRYFIDPEIVAPLSNIPQDIREKYLKDDTKYSINNPIIQNAVKEAVQDEKNPYWIARRIYKYVQDKMYYELSGGWNIAPTVLKRGSGSCSEYSFVYIAMCRAAGIPTRFAGSVVIRGDDTSYDDVFHRWVEIYLPNYGWIPVDPSGGDEIEPEKQAEFFGGLKNRFLITTTGAGSSEYLGWEYNSSSSYECTGRCKIMTKKGGKWEPVGKKYERAKEGIFTLEESPLRGCH
ncbi:MAG: transglutaminase domain-containing protein [Myxococcota bacterium]